MLEIHNGILLSLKKRINLEHFDGPGEYHAKWNVNPQKSKAKCFLWYEDANSQ